MQHVPQPRVWLVIGDKSGDNAQVKVVADALGWDYQVKILVFRPDYVIGKPRFSASIYHIDRQQSDVLAPPWPDLILTAGSRPSMVALWIQKQSKYQTKLVIFGRPKRYLHRFSLIVANPQYGIPLFKNVMRLKLPLMRVNEKKTSKAAQSLPYLLLLVGGATKPFVFDANTASDLMCKVRHLVSILSMQLYIMTSRRTPNSVVDIIEQGMPSNAKLFRWAPGDVNNPYSQLLGDAEHIIVSGDSVSMMVEAAKLGKSLAIYPLPINSGKWNQFKVNSTRFVYQCAISAESYGFATRLVTALLYVGLLGYPRDITAVHRILFREKCAVKLGESFSPPSQSLPDEAPMVASRIKSLF